jgi:hypothetical protein
LRGRDISTSWEIPVHRRDPPSHMHSHVVGYSLTETHEGWHLCYSYLLGQGKKPERRQPFLEWKGELCNLASPQVVIGATWWVAGSKDRWPFGACKGLTTGRFWRREQIRSSGLDQRHHVVKIMINRMVREAFFASIPRNHHRHSVHGSLMKLRTLSTH